MAPENIDPPTLAELPPLADRDLEMWLKFLAAEVNFLVQANSRLVPRIIRLESAVKYWWGVIGVVIGVLFGHLDWKAS